MRNPELPLERRVRRLEDLLLQIGERLRRLNEERRAGYLTNQRIDSYLNETANDIERTLRPR